MDNDTDNYLLKNKSGKWGTAVDWEIDNTAETTYVSANLKKANEAWFLDSHREIK